MAVLKDKKIYEEAVRDSLSIAGVCRRIGLKPYGGNIELFIRLLKHII